MIEGRKEGRKEGRRKGALDIGLLFLRSLSGIPPRNKGEY
jgi:hypothetical protein